MSGRRARKNRLARNATNVAPAAQSGQAGVSHTRLVSGHLAWRSRSNMPQWPAARPSKLTFQGWSKASITKYSRPRRSASTKKRRRNVAWFTRLARAAPMSTPFDGQPTSPITTRLPGKRAATASYFSMMKRSAWSIGSPSQ
jgi:hypothetical protein